MVEYATNIIMCYIEWFLSMISSVFPLFFNVCLNDDLRVSRWLKIYPGLLQKGASPPSVSICKTRPQSWSLFLDSIVS